MRIITRYLYSELLPVLLYCLTGFTVFWVVYDLVDELGGFQARGLSVVQVARYYWILLPEVVVNVLPVALLLATLYTISNHARYNEFTALRVAGIGIWQISHVYISVGVFCGALLFFLNEVWVPDAREKASRLLRQGSGKEGAETEVLKLNGFANFRDGRMWQFASLNVESGLMLEPKVDWRLPDGRYREIIADRACWTNGMWEFYEVRENTYSPEGGLVSRLFLERLPLMEFNESPKEMLSQLRVNRRLSLGKAKRAEVPISEIVSYLRYNPSLQSRERAWLLTQLHGRIAFPWTCVVVVFIALPFSSISTKKGVYMGVASSIGICFAYLVVMQIGLALGSGGYLPPWLGAWLPNLVFGTIGAFWTSRAA